MSSEVGKNLDSLGTWTSHFIPLCLISHFLSRQSCHDELSGCFAGKKVVNIQIPTLCQQEGKENSVLCSEVFLQEASWKKNAGPWKLLSNMISVPSLQVPNFLAPSLMNSRRQEDAHTLHTHTHRGFFSYVVRMGEAGRSRAVQQNRQDLRFSI